VTALATSALVALPFLLVGGMVWRSWRGYQRDLRGRPLRSGALVTFDPARADTATNSADALELARAWADGRRSWINRRIATGTEAHSELLAQEAAIATMDAQEVVKWSTLALAFREMERDG